MELGRVRLVVNDFQTMFRYYGDVIGLTPQTDDLELQEWVLPRS